MRLRMIIPVEPITVQSGARVGKGRFYNDPKKVAYYEGIRREVEHLLPAEAPISTPVAVSYDFYLPRPKRLEKKKSPTGRIEHDKHPDTDNLVKGLSDALAKAGLLEDDKIVWSVYARKWYVERNLMPRIEVDMTYEK